MDSNNKVDVARKVFDNGLNCSQAVFGVFSEEIGLDKEVAYKIAAGLGGGLRQGEICGAITGAVMALGLKYGNYEENNKDAKKQSYQLTEDFIDRFREIHQKIRCKDLLGYSVASPEEYRVIKDQNLFHTICPVLIADAVGIVETMINDKENN